MTTPNTPDQPSGDIPSYNDDSVLLLAESVVAYIEDRRSHDAAVLAEVRALVASVRDMPVPVVNVAAPVVNIPAAEVRVENTAPRVQDIRIVSAPPTRVRIKRDRGGRVDLIEQED